MKALFALLLLGCVGLGYSIEEYDLSSYCGSSINVTSAAKLTLSDYQSNADCIVSVYSNLHHSVLWHNNLRLEIRSMDMPCGNHYMEIYDGSQNTGHLLNRITCISYLSNYMTSIYNYMTFVIHPIEYFTSMELLATATSRADYQSGHFICRNQYDIDSSLQLDGYNNCGDWSDEDWTIRIFIISASCVFAVVILLFVTIVLIVRRRRRLHNAYQRRVHPVHPVYGTIQVGGSYMAQSPPYSPKGEASYYSTPQYGAAPPQFGGAYTNPATATTVTATTTSTTTSAAATDAPS